MFIWGSAKSPRNYGHKCLKIQETIEFIRLFPNHRVPVRSNGVRVWLSVLAYNPGNLWWRLVLPKRVDHWSLTSLQQRLV